MDELVEAQNQALEMNSWSLKTAFDFYTEKWGWTAHSFGLTTTKQGGGYKKELHFAQPWKATPSRFADRNALMVNTEMSKLVVIDVDHKPGGGGLDAWTDIELKCGGPFKTFTVGSGTGGVHIYFKVDGLEDSRLNASIAKQFSIDGKQLDIDLRAKGGCIIAPPTRYKAGPDRLEYRVIDEAEPIVMPAALSDYLLSLLPPLARVRAPSRVGGAPTPTPQQDDTTRGTAGDVDPAAITRARDVLKMFQTEGIAPEVHDAIWSNHDAITRIAFATNNVCGGEDTLLEDFIALVKSSDKAQDNCAEWATQLYNTPPNGGNRPGLPYLTALEETFINATRIDPPWRIAFNQAHAKALYGNINKEALANLLRQAVYDEKSFTEYDFSLYIAEAFHHLFRYGKDTTQKKGDAMYRFDGSRHVIETGPHNFSTESRIAIIEILDTILSDERCASFKVGIGKRIRWVKSNSYKAVCAEAEILLMSDTFYTSRNLMRPAEFYNCLDSNPFLIGFTNGVFDLQACVFHKKGSIPSGSYVSYSTGYEYIGDATGEPIDEAQRQAMEEVYNEIYMKTFPRDEVRTCVEAMAGALLISGSGVTKKLFLLVGPKGDNGKTSFAHLFEVTLGDYFYTLPHQILTDTKQNVEGCNPTLSAARKRKMCVLNEGAAKAHLQNDIVKKLTGGDALNYRDLYGQSISASFNPKLWYLANEPPLVKDESDKAYNKRLYGIDFESSFVENLDEDEPLQKKFKGIPEAIQKERHKEMKALHMMLLIRFAKHFLANLNSKLPALPQESDVANMMFAGTAENVVKAWLFENFEVTEGSFAEHISDVDKRYNTVKNFMDVWSDFQREHPQITNKEHFEKILKDNKVVVKAVNNQWVGSIKKAALLRRKELEQDA